MATKKQPKAAPPRLSRAEKFVGQSFAAGGYLRMPDTERAGDTSYRKGWEARLTADDEESLAFLREQIAKVGLTPGKAFKKHNKHVVPIYGREAVETLQRLRKAVE
jgi:hypothetical protein